MPACTMPGTPTAKKDFDYFQRKKVGSIRDNPKLLKIRQRFENASENAAGFTDPKSPHPTSAPCSISFSRATGSGVLEELIKNNSVYSEKTEAFLKSQFGLRRHSESEAGSQSVLSVFNSKETKNGKSSPSLSNLVGNSKQNGSSCISLTSKSDSRSSLFEKRADQRKPATNKENLVLKSLELKSCKSLLEDLHPATPKASNSVENKVQIFENADVSAPPIPKRGISPAVKKNMVSPLSLSSSQNEIPSSAEGSRLKSSPVKKTIQMYEGMCTGDKRTKSKHNSASKSTKKDLSSGSFRSSGVTRRSSRKNSMRKSRCVAADAKSERINNASVRARENAEESCSKEDSGIGSSDAEDRTQAIYQTLTSVERDHDDPYDRLNRVHDVVARVHKGQISSCAACKTLPRTISQWPDADESSFLRVKCHEVTPHHHPPCICFSCSHSVFSCSLDDVELFPLAEDALYSNVCCLNSPDREGWRQSRRRPVCERNGRLCVVNCDMEQRRMEACYDQLYQCNSSSPKMCSGRKRHPSKPVSGRFDFIPLFVNFTQHGKATGIMNIALHSVA